MLYLDLCLILNFLSEIKNNKGKKLDIVDDSMVQDMYAFRDLMKETGLSATALADELGDVNPAIVDFGKIAGTSGMSAKGFKTHVDGVNNSIGLMGIKAKASSVGLGVLNAALTMGVALIASFMIEKVVEGIDDIIHHEENLAKASNDAKNNIDQLKSSFEGLKDTTDGIKERYAELAQGVDQLNGKNVRLSNDDYEEFLDLSNQLAELFPTLTKNYDENGNAILDLSGNVDTIVGSLNTLIKTEQELTNQKMLENMPAVYEDLQSEMAKYNQEIENYKTLSNVIPENFEINNLGKTSFSFEDIDGDVVQAYLYDYIREQFNAQLEEYELDNVSFDITSDLSTGGMQLDIEGLENTEEYYNKLGQIYDNIRVDIIGKIQGINGSIKTEMSGFNKYIYSWLSQDGNYTQMEEGLQTAIQQILYNSNWMSDLPDTVDATDWDQVAEWLGKKYLGAINQIEDSGYKEKLADLFNPDLDIMDKLDLANEIQTYFNDNDIQISLDFILNKDSLHSTANIVERMKESFKEATGSVDELEQIYNQTHKFRKKEYAGSNYVGNVDINNRPIVTNSELDGDYQTSYTGFQEYWKGDKDNGHYEIIHFTPILPDGTVLDDATLYDYLDNVIAKADNALEADKVENGGKGILYKVDTDINGQKITDNNLDQAFAQAEQWDIGMHDTYASMYDKEAYALIEYNKALEEQNRLVQYFNDHDINTEQAYEKWLDVTQGVQSAEEKIRKYDESLSSISDKDYSFFTEENNSLIDRYVSKIDELTGYYNKLHTAEGLSHADKLKLTQAYGIAGDSNQDYINAILNEITNTEQFDEVIELLKQSIEECTDAQEKMRLEACLDNLQGLSKEAIEAAEGFDNIGNAMSSLKSRADLLREIDESINEFGEIDTSQLNEMLSLFPELETQISLYNAGLIDSTELFNLLSEAYQTDSDLYGALMADKLQYNEGFYSSIYDDLPQHIKELASSYDIDLKNYTTLCAAKLDLETQLAEKRVALNKAITKAYEISKDQYASPEEKEKVQNEYRAVQKEFNEIQSILDSVKNTSFKQFNTSWQNFGKSNTKGKDDPDKKEEEKKTPIDWVDQSLKVLQETVDDVQTELENTSGLDAQLDAIDKLNAALKELKKGYKKAYTEYETRYNAGLQKLSNPEEIQRKIESGKSFKLKEYKQEDAEIIQELIDLYAKMQEAENKMAELGLQIDDNENIEKSKLRQADYEKTLEGIQTKLEDQTLTTEERNDLLKDQLETQKAINEELAKQAEYEGDEEGAAILRGKNKILEQQTFNETLQGDMDKNNLYIESLEKQLENTDLTSDQKDDLNLSLQEFKDKNFQYQFKQMREKLKEGVWDSYIKSLKKNYGEKKMDDDAFIQKHLQEIAEHFKDTGMESLYYDYVNFGKDNEQIAYDTDKAERSYYINDNANQIKDIQNKINLNGGIGTEQDYEDMKTLNEDTITYWEQQKAAAEDMLKDCTEGTQAWNDWNAELQEAEDNINSCEMEIKNCELAILKLPLNDIDMKLMDIQNHLDDINELIEYNNTYISAASFIIDKEVRGHEKSKELIQDQIDALEKANNVRKSSLALQQAEYNLRRAEEQRSSRIFKEGVGWVYESDPTEVQSAREQYEQALYDNKVSELNEQIRLHDEEIKVLNRIKDEWSWIATEAQGTVDVNKAFAYDLEFESKVLSGNLSLIQGITDAMKNYYSDKTMYEDEQKQYQKLQDVINDTATEYDLGAIEYEEARQKISNAIKTYYPEVFAKYGEESKKVQEVIDKKLEEAGITETSSQQINEAVDESNTTLVESYNTLVEDLDTVFRELNKMLSNYAKNAVDTAQSVADSIQDIKNSMNGTAVSTAVSGVKKTTTTKTTSKGTNIKTAGKSHSGMELGYIGDGSTSGDKKAFKYIALNELKDDEIVRVLQKNEAVLTETQVFQTMDNFRKLAEFKTPTLALRNTQPSQSVEFKGDIVINNPIGDSSMLARDISKNLSQAVLQELYK